MKVLIADDQQSTRKGLRALLSAWPGIELVGEAVNGQESVDIAAEQHPDVVLMDVQMPVLDGLEATRHIKNQWPEIRVIVLTMHADYRNQALASGADDFLLKGCPANKLLDAILANG